MLRRSVQPKAIVTRTTPAEQY